MRPTFYPSLINDAYNDPGLYIQFLLEGRAFIFDLGDLYNLSAKSILKLSHAFVTHTHMDHFAGLDRLLRLTLGRDKIIHLFGPENFLVNIEGKLAAYTWNLADNYKDCLTLHATEVRADKRLTQTYQLEKRFVPENPPASRPLAGDGPITLLDESGLTVSAILLDHGTPCLGFCLHERFHINIRGEALTALGLEPGAWIKEFKTALFENAPGDTLIVAPTDKGPRQFRVDELTEKIALISPGQKITYIADASGSAENERRIIEFAKDADHLFIEAYFLEKDRDIADQKFHLTAAQAGKIAGLANVKRLNTFHYSPRYADMGQRNLPDVEAQKAYQAMLKSKK